MEKFNTEKRTENKIEIQPRGSYFQVDQEGFLINPASPDKIQGEWKAALDDVTEVYKKEYGPNLKNVYVRGSVATGEALMDKTSDLDAFAYVDLEEEKIDPEWTKVAPDQLLEKYPFVEKFELVVSPVSEAAEDTIILNQALCIYGEPINVPKLKPGKELARHAPTFGSDLEDTKSFFEKELDDDHIRGKCAWLMKTILRVGFEITMERCKKYTRDLYPCYETFSEYYPEKEAAMREVFHYALNPTANKEKIIEVIDTLGAWLAEESEKYF